MMTFARSGVREATRGLLIILVLGVTAAKVTHASLKPGGDLFDQEYEYLIRGDEKFAALATNYIHTLPSPDTMFGVEIRPLGKTSSGALPSGPHYLSFSVKRPMAIRVIFADSSTINFIAFDFKEVPAGDYSIGVEDWPAALREEIAAGKRYTVFLAVDQKLQGRYRFEVDSNLKMVRLEKPVVPRD